jgi:putative ABC transport system substrate-binding protein
MRRRDAIGLIGASAAWPLGADAQHSRSLPKVGLLFPGPEALATVRSAPMLEGLRSAGIDVPTQATLVARATGGDPTRVAPLLADLIADKVNVIVPLSPQMVRAAHAATSSIPIVTFDLESDPVEDGLMANFAHPGGAVTGVFLDFPDFSRVWLQFLREAVPGLSKLVAIWDPNSATVQTTAVAAAAAGANVKIDVLEIRSPAGLGAVFEATSALRPDGVMLLSSPTMSIFSKQIAELAAKHRLPTISMSYGPDLDALYRKVGILVAKVLKGAPPAEIPAERPDRFELVLNMTAARNLALTIPNAFLARPDEVIE